MRCRFTVIRLVITRKTTFIVSVDEDVEKLEPLYIVGRNAKWYSYLEKSLAVPPKVEHEVTM